MTGFKPIDFAGRAVVGGRCLTRLAPAAAPAEQSDRTIRFVFSDGSVDSYGDRLDPAGWDLRDFNANPIALFGHDPGSVENIIGRAKNVGTVGARLMGSIEFASASVNPLAETVFQMLKQGFLSACSVGFIPIEFKYTTDKSRPVGGIDFIKQKLLEISVVPIPANPNALVQARSAGLDLQPLTRWAESALDRGDAQIAREDLEMIRRSAGAPRQYAAPIDHGREERAAAARERAAKLGRGDAPFASFGEFLRAVASSAIGGRTTDPRLVRAPTGLNETTPSQGGFLIPSEWEVRLIESLYSRANLLPLCDRRQTDRVSDVKIPAISEQSRADGSRSGGALSYWAAEAANVSSSYPRFGQLNFSAHTLVALCPVTNELLGDAPMLEGHLTSVFAAEANFQLDRAILRGVGSGQFLGIVNAPGTITVPKANGQAPGTIIGENVLSMYSSLAAPCRKNAVWVVSEDVDAQLDAIGASGASPSAAALYMPQGSANGNPWPLLKGRPVITSEVAAPLGTPGDIVLADFSHYIVIDYGMKTDVSMDVNFLTDGSAFRFRFRGDGKPAWSSPIQSWNGSGLRSPYVALAQR